MGACGDDTFEFRSSGPIRGHAHVASLEVSVGIAGDRSAPRILAGPQSMTCTSPNAPIMTLAGLRSRWMTSCEWA